MNTSSLPAVDGLPSGEDAIPDPATVDARSAVAAEVSAAESDASPPATMRPTSSTAAIVVAVLAVAFVLGALPMPGLVGELLAERLEMSSAVTLAALVLLGGVLWLRARLSEARVPADAQEQPPGTGALASAT